MTTIYELQQRAKMLRTKTQTGSITPDEVGSLHEDTLAHIATLEQSADSLGIKKVYPSKSAMEADTTPVGNNGKVICYGQLVSIYDAAHTDSIENGNIYAYQKPGWLLTGKICGDTKLPVVQETGDSPTKVMSQKAVTDALGKATVTTDDGKTLQDVYELTKNVGTIETDVFNLIANTENLCYFTNGTTYKGLNWTSGEKQPVGKSHVLQGKMLCYRNMPAVVFFDAAGQMCGYAGNNTVSESAVVTYDTSKEGGIPANAVTFQLQGMNTPAEVAKGVAKKIVSEKNMISDIKEDFDNFKGTLDNTFVKNNVTIPLLTEPLTKERAVYSISGELKLYAAWGRTDLIVVQPPLVLKGRVIGFKDKVPPIVFFDKNFDFVSAINAPAEGVFVDIDTSRSEQKIPDDAAYFLIQTTINQKNSKLDAVVNLNQQVEEHIVKRVPVPEKESRTYPNAQLLVPRTVYTVANDAGKSELTGYSPNTYTPTLYLDNFFTGLKNEPKAAYFGNGTRKLLFPFKSADFATYESTKLFDGTAKVVEEDTQYSIVGNTKEEQLFTVKNRQSLNSPSKNKHMALLCIGDSITYGQNAYFFDRGQRACYPMLVRELGYKDYLASGKSGYEIRTIGTLSHTRKMSYAGKEYELTTYHEGRQGDWLQNFMAQAYRQDESGNFSLLAYLKKYRTCDDKGNRLYADKSKGTRKGYGEMTGYLENGEDSGFKIGSEILDTTVHDVYKPTHVFLFMGTNGQYSQEELDKFIAGIRTAGEDIIIGVGCPHYAGTYFPSDYPNFIGCEHWTLGESQPQIILQKMLNGLDATTYEAKGVYFIDTFWTNPAAYAAPCAHINEPASAFTDDAVFKKFRPLGQGIYQHVSSYAHAAYAYQVYAWMKWTLAKGT